MMRARSWKRIAGVIAVAAVLLLPALAAAGPRSGGSFGGRGGFRSAPSGGFRTPSGGGYSTGRGYGYSTGPSFFFFPGFGYGGCGGGGLLGGIILLVVLGVAAASISRAARRLRGGPSWGEDEDQDLDQAYLVRLQIALGRSARSIQDRLAKFASEGDTSSPSGLQALLQQTTLELLRERDAFRYVHVDLGGRQSLPAAEAKMNGMALEERSRFQVERVRSADGTVRRASEAPEEGKEALEYVMVTLIAATRSPVADARKRGDGTSLDEVRALLSGLGGVSPDSLLGLEVIWTPADPDDSLTETDLLTTYPDLRSV